MKKLFIFIFILFIIISVVNGQTQMDSILNITGSQIEYNLDTANSQILWIVSSQGLVGSEKYFKVPIIYRIKGGFIVVLANGTMAVTLQEALEGFYIVNNSTIKCKVQYSNESEIWIMEEFVSVMDIHNYIAIQTISEK